MSEIESKNQNQKTPNQKFETETNINAKLKLEIKRENFEPQRFEDNSEKIESKMDLNDNSKTIIILQLETQFFAYENHIKNAR